MEYNSRQSITAPPKESPVTSLDKSKRRPRRERSVKPETDTSGNQFNQSSDDNLVNIESLEADEPDKADIETKDLSIKLFNFKVFSKLVMPSAVLHRHPSAPTYNYLNPFQRALPRSWS